MLSTRARFGLIPLTSEPVTLRRTILPLKAVQSRFLIRGGVAEVEIVQVYRQENPQALDCQYQFPLPADASVYRCEAFINDRVIRAQVEERHRARQLAQEKKQAGHRVALVEAQRDNLFTLSLSNLQPDDLVEVRLAYIQPLRRVVDRFSLEIPFCPGIRYIPGKPLLRSNRGKGIFDDTDQVPDASLISPPRIDAGHPDAAFIDVEGKIEARFLQPGSLASPSHDIEVNQVKEMVRVTLKHKDDVPDRDLALRWQEKAAEALTPRAWRCRKGEEAYVLMEVRAPRETVDPQAAPQDVYFLVDRSGSMQGEKWEKAVEALQSCVSVLGSRDRAMVTLFNNTCRDFAEKPLAPAEIAADPNFQDLARGGADGGTEMLPALTHVLDLVKKHSDGRRTNLVLITDAQIGNEAGVLEAMRAMPAVPVHCFGIDITLNDSLLLELTRQQGGTFHSLHPSDDIRGAVTALGRTLRQPVLLNLLPAEGWELATARIPDLYAGQVCYVSARSHNGEVPPALHGKDAQGKSVSIGFAAEEVGNLAGYLHWCKGRIQDLIVQGKQKEAITLSKSSNLICPLTAFVAWDEKEKVVVAEHELVQPALADSSMLGIACAPPACYSLAEPAADTDMSVGRTIRRMAARSIPSRRSLGAGVPKVDTARQEERIARLCQLCGRPEWASEFERILDWVKAAPDGSKRLERLSLLDELLSELEELAARIRDHSESLMQIYGEVVARSKGMASTLAHWEDEGYGDPTPLKNASRELQMVLRAIETAMIRAPERARIETELREKLADFIDRHVVSKNPPTSIQKQRT
jgi:Ca-activated chloride channel homolog